MQIRVAFIWHQHQPYYKEGNSYLLPWARLHATKDYYDMAAALEPFTTLRQTTNVVPSLIVQLLDYVDNGASDIVLDLSRTPADALSADEMTAILRSFFLCNAPRMIQPYERYRELYERAGSGIRDDEAQLAKVRAEFSAQDWRDLQVWYNLTWIGEYSREREPFAKLLAKGRNFSEDEKHELLDASLQIVAQVVPMYRSMMESGRLELSVTPFYHPILPILCDSASAREALPAITLPTSPIVWPDDARTQIDRAVELFEQQFGRKPSGMWPSEGSVSTAALELIASRGLSWVATDEEILRRTRAERATPLDKYFPWTITTPSGPLWILFRDHVLSDAIGFVYSSWNPRDAAADFYQRIIDVRNRIIQERGAAALDDAIVPIILDGENCWEYYEANGRPFLESLYGLLAASSEVITTTIADELGRRSPTPERTLDRIAAGSWIGANFRIWIGHAEDNAAWDALAAARQMLIAAKDRIDPGVYAEAMEEVYIAEGSDWYWWYGDENVATNQDDFDRLFRYHVRRIYELADETPSSTLDVPLRLASRTKAVTQPTQHITPQIDGRRGGPDWDGAGDFIVERVGGTMHRADVFERRVFFGSDASHLYLRYDTTMPLDARESVRMRIGGEREIVITFTATSVSIEATADADGIVSIAGVVAAIVDTLETAIPLSCLGQDGLASVGLVFEIVDEGHVVDRFPLQGVVECLLR